MDKDTKSAKSGFITFVMGIFLTIFSGFAFVSLAIFFILIADDFIAIVIALFPLLLLGLWLAVGITAIVIGKKDKTFRVGISILWMLLLPIFGIAFLIDSACQRVE